MAKFHSECQFKSTFFSLHETVMYNRVVSFYFASVQFSLILQFKMCKFKSQRNLTIQ